MDDVEPVDGLGEPQVGVDAGDHDARVDGQDLDPDQRDPDEGVDDDALVQDDLDDVGEPAGSRTLDISPWWCGYGDGVSSPVPVSR